MLAVTLLVGAALGASACGAVTVAPAERAERAPTYGERVAADARALARITTPFQAEMLLDGEVTFAEYERSTRAMVRCLRESTLPIRVGPIRPQPGGELVFDWFVRVKRTTAFSRLEAHATAVFERCHRLYEADVKTIYSNQRVVPPERRPTVLRRLVGCLRRAGLEVEPARPSMKRLIAILDADRPELGKPCTDRYADFFRLPAPVPIEPSPFSLGGGVSRGPGRDPLARLS